MHLLSIHVAQTTHTNIYLHALKHVPKTNPRSRAHTVYSANTNTHIYAHTHTCFQGTIGAIRGMFGPCYLNK